MKIQRGALAALTVLFAGCTGSPTAAVAPPGPTGSAAPPAPSAASPAPNASASATAAQPVPAAATEPSPFVVVAQRPVEVRLFPARGALFVADTEPHVDEHDEYASAIGRMVGDHLETPPNMRLPDWMHVLVALEGEWPGTLDLLLTGSTGRTAVAEHWTLHDTGWVQQHGTEGSAFVGMARVGTSVVAMEAPFMFGVTHTVTLRGSARLDLTKATDPACVGDGGWSQRSEAVRSSAFGATSAGTAISFGWGCGEDPPPLAEVWKQGSRKATVLPLPPAPKSAYETLGEGARVVAGPGDTAYLVAGALVHYDGEGFRLVDTPEGRPVDAAAAAPDGTLWAIAAGEVHARAPGAEAVWRRVTLPPAFAAVAGGPSDIVATADGTVWVTGGGVVIRTGRPPEGLGEISIAGTGRAAAPARPALPKPGGPHCPRNLVVLYGFTKVTPEDFDFPLTRAALKGHVEFGDARFVITRDLGHKFLSAFVPTFDLGKRLQAHIEKKVQGSKPQVVCADPEVLREFPIDLRTGELVKPAP